jgi:hypothetical protein
MRKHLAMVLMRVWVIWLLSSTLWIVGVICYAGQGFDHPGIVVPLALLIRTLPPLIISGLTSILAEIARP